MRSKKINWVLTAAAFVMLAMGGGGISAHMNAKAKAMMVGGKMSDMHGGMVVMKRERMTLRETMPDAM